MRYIFLSIFLISIGLKSQSQGHDSLFLQSALIKLKNSKDYTVKVADLMPEEKYGFRATAEEMSFQEQLLHICANLSWLSSSYLSNGNHSKYTIDKNIQGKDSIIAVINQTYDFAISVMSDVEAKKLGDSVKFFAGPMRKLQIINLISDHQTHHRGQLLVYLRLCGLTPPRYVGW